MISAAAENQEIYQIVLIDEKFESAEDAIISYCRGKSVKLLTADKSIVLNARMYGVGVKYLKKEKGHNIPVKQTAKGKETLFSARHIGDLSCQLPIMIEFLCLSGQMVLNTLMEWGT